jgi:hypothetical protein
MFTLRSSPSEVGLESEVWLKIKKSPPQLPHSKTLILKPLILKIITKKTMTLKALH